MAVWDRRSDETEVEYARFAAYLRLGPLRTLAAAYNSYTQDLANAVPGVKKRRAPGNWHTDSVKFQWRRRCAAWDVYNLKHYGKRAAVLYVRSLELAAAKVYRTLRAGGPDLGAEAWPDILAVLKLLGDQLPADTLRGEDDDTSGGGDTGAGATRDPATVE